MILRLANYTILGIALFYALEGAGVVEKGRYFPTLPRLEARASDPYAWLGAAQWGFSQLGQVAMAQGAESSFATGSLPSFSGGNGESFTDSLQKATESFTGSGAGSTTRYLGRYYGS